MRKKKDPHALSTAAAGIVLLFLTALLQLLARKLPGFGTWYAHHIYPWIVGSVGRLTGLVRFRSWRSVCMGCLFCWCSIFFFCFVTWCANCCENRKTDFPSGSSCLPCLVAGFLLSDCFCFCIPPTAELIIMRPLFPPMQVWRMEPIRRRSWMLCAASL